MATLQSGLFVEILIEEAFEMLSLVLVIKKLTITSQLGMSYSRGVTTDPRSVIQTIKIFDDGRPTV